MLFNSLTYFIFLAFAVCIYWALPHRLRTRFLLAMSLLFYCAWDWRYGSLLVGAVVFNYVGARYVAKLRQRWVIVLVIAINLLVLVYFKYLGFFAESANDLFALLGGTRSIPVMDIVLPLGISFFIFQCMSYVIDVSRGDQTPEWDFERFALYVTFWPQLVAGPIMRAHELTHQFALRHTARYEDFAFGARRIIEGLFLKVVLADNLAGYIDEGFAKSAYIHNSALDNWTLAFGFGFQIYFDFAGYSSIAIGSARLLGIRLTENFNYPYVATSPREFWQRWHITLSSWIRDYLYIPMQGLVAQGSRSGGGIDVQESAEVVRRDSAGIRNLALFLTWILMGLWHGANWTFVAWGVWHAGLVLIGRLLTRHFPYPEGPTAAMLTRWASLLATLGVVMASWIFFRAETLGQAFTMLATLLDPTEYTRLGYKENFYLIVALITAAFFVHHWLAGSGEQLGENSEQPARATDGRDLWWVGRAFGYATMVVLVLGYLRAEQQFIYFQF